MSSSVIGRSLHKSKSNENLYRCYGSSGDDNSPCETSTLYEKMPQFCTQQDSEVKCQGDIAQLWCSWTGTECKLKDTGMLDLVKPA